MTKAYKLEVLVIDHEGSGEEQIKTLIEQNRYISPRVMSSKGVDIGEWHDGHPLNWRDKALAEFKRLFKGDEE